MTNATVDLSALGLSSSANLVQSSANVFTNSFTVPATAPVGVANVTVTVIEHRTARWERRRHLHGCGPAPDKRDRRDRPHQYQRL